MDAQKMASPLYLVDLNVIFLEVSELACWRQLWRGHHYLQETTGVTAFKHHQAATQHHQSENLCVVTSLRTQTRFRKWIVLRPLKKTPEHFS